MMFYKLVCTLDANPELLERAETIVSTDLFAHYSPAALHSSRGTFQPSKKIGNAFPTFNTARARDPPLLDAPLVVTYWEIKTG